MAGKWMTPFAAVWSLRPWNSNPLVRRAERVEGAVMILVVAAVLLVVPIAAAVGTAVYSAEAVAIRVERSSRHVVEAVVVDEPRKQWASSGPPPLGGTRGITRTPPRFRWGARSNAAITSTCGSARTEPRRKPHAGPMPRR